MQHVIKIQDGGKVSPDFFFKNLYSVFFKAGFLFLGNRSSFSGKIFVQGV
jgi:hypothetical protein